MRGSLPSDQELPDGLELRLGQSLGKNVGLLLLGIDVPSNNAFVLPNLASEEVVLQSQILVAGGHLGDIDQRQTSLVVLKDGGSDGALLDEVESELGADLVE